MALYLERISITLNRKCALASLVGRIFCGKPPKSAVADLGDIDCQSRVNPRSVPTFPENALVCALALVLGYIAPVHAQSFPSKAIKLVVPFGPGGPTDVSARIVAQVVQSALGQSVVIENRPGAGGALGTKSVAGAEPDGHTLLIGTSATLGVVPALMKNPGYDPIRSFAPVAKVADSTLVLVAPATFSATSVAE